MSATRSDVGLCLLRLCGFSLTRHQASRLQSLGLLDDLRALTPLGNAEAYTALAMIRWGGSNQARQVIAEAARNEAADWQAEIDRRKAQAAGKGGG